MSLVTAGSNEWGFNENIHTEILQKPVDGNIVPVEVLKANLNISADDTSEDAYLLFLEKAAIDLLQRYTGRYFLTHKLKQIYERTPTTGLAYNRETVPTAPLPRNFTLEYAPAPTVEELKLIDESDTEYIIDTTDYVTLTEDENRRSEIELRRDYTWQNNDSVRVLKAIEIKYDCGYGDDGDDVPATLQLAITRLVTYLYSNRGDCGCSNASEVVENTSAGALAVAYVIPGL